jgi:microcystin-dependent protein
MMAATAKYRDDIAGAIVTTGTSTAYAVSSYQVFDSPAHLNGQMIAFTPHVTNGATVTLNVDGLGAKPLRTAPGTDLLAGMIIQGTPYVATYNNSDGAFYLQGFFGSPYNVPLAAGMDYWAATAPNSSFAFPTGQAISRSIYASLFAIIGTTYGVGDGSATFNLPDKTGRVSAMKEAAASRLTSSGFGGNSANMGAVGGVEMVAITASQVPTLTASGSNTITVQSNVGDIVRSPNGMSSVVGGGGGNVLLQSGAFTTQITSIGTNNISAQSLGTGGAGGGAALAHSNVQPTIVCNYIMRII